MTSPPAGRRGLATPAVVGATFAAGVLGLVLLCLVGTVIALGRPSGPGSAAEAQPAATTSTRSGSAMPTAVPTSAPSRAPTTAPGDSAAGSAAALLAGLPVKGRAPRTGFDRGLFGPAWADTDRNGCDTRNDILRRDLRNVTLEEGTNGCVVLTGTLDDPFSGRTMTFTRGADSSAIQIDHVVALSDAWQKGAQQWSPGRRLAFANDPLNLLAVDGPLNMAKSDGDAATWLPPDRAYRCRFAARQVAVKAKYGAWVTSAEHDALGLILSTCPAEPVPRSDALPESDLGAAREPVPAPSPAATAPSPAASALTPAVPAPVPAASSHLQGAACDPAYPDVCIPPYSWGDLDCADVEERMFRVLPPDPHRFDGQDGNGWGCESG